MMPATPDEYMVVCMARHVQDGELVVQGLATPLVAAAYMLARHTHAPDLYFASAIGQSICRRPAPIGLTRIEGLWLDHSLNHGGFVRAVADVLPRLHPKEFFRPAQVDREGNFNNIAFGENYARPRLRLPGTGGIPDVTTFSSDVCLYVPRHSRVTFVKQLDYLSGLGHHPARRMGAGPVILVSDMGVFDFSQGHLRLVSYHPGATPTAIQARTGFDLDIAPDVHETLPPPPEELHLLRSEIDPLGTRRLETLSGAERRQLLHQIIQAESMAGRLDFQ